MSEKADAKEACWQYIDDLALCNSELLNLLLHFVWTRAQQHGMLSI